MDRNKVPHGLSPSAIASFQKEMHEESPKMQQELKQRYSYISLDQLPESE